MNYYQNIPVTQQVYQQGTKNKAELANKKLNATYKFPSTLRGAERHTEANKVGKRSINLML